MVMSRKRLLAATFTLVAAGMTALAVEWVDSRLGDVATLTGWTLLVSTAGLYLLSARKRLPQSRLGPVSFWLQLHAYTGAFACCVFLMHIGWPIRGWFEACLAACFAVVSISGIVLGVMSRATPRKLTAIPGDYRLEQIPALQSRISQEAHQTALHSAQLGEGATLAEYYQRQLLPFFQSPRSWTYRVVPNGIKRRQLLRELDDLQRYLAESGSESRRQLMHMVQSKDDLDYHLALQSRLRLLFALHVALTWTLALMIGVHVALVYRFQGVML